MHFTLTVEIKMKLPMFRFDLTCITILFKYFLPPIDSNYTIVVKSLGVNVALSNVLGAFTILPMLSIPEE